MAPGMLITVYVPSFYCPNLRNKLGPVDITIISSNSHGITDQAAAFAKAS